MNKDNVSQSQISQTASPGKQGINEDWSAVMIAFALCLLTVIGFIGPKFLYITF